MPRLSRACLITFLATVGFFLHQVFKHQPFDFAFLLMGATGCLYLLILATEHFAAQPSYHVTHVVKFGMHPVLAPKAPRKIMLRNGYTPERRSSNSQRWPRNLERRKSAREALAPVC